MRRSGWAIGVRVAVGAALLIGVGGAMAEGGNGPVDVTMGHPWTGAAGIQRTVSAIMDEQRARTAPTARIVPPEHDAGLHRRPNPDSPAATPDSKFGAGLAAGPKLSVGSSF